jgi:glycosyltransferase involved in cell wall biosynthesis
MVRGPRVLALLPAYREERTVGGVVSALKAQGFDVLVVDDASPDGTARAAAEAGADVVRLPVNLGYGGALQTGYMYALRNAYRAVVQLDADGQHDPASAADLLAPVLAGEADVVLGSRFAGGQSYPMPWARRLGQRLFGGIATLITRRRITDPTTGYQALSPRVLEAYCTALFPDDYPDADMLVLLHRMGLRVVEAPARIHARSAKSMHGGLLRPLYYIYKMTLAIFMATIRDLPRKEQP